MPPGLDGPADAHAEEIAFGGKLNVGPGLDGEPCALPSMERCNSLACDIARASLSNIGLDPRLLLGLDSGRELVINTESRRGV